MVTQASGPALTVAIVAQGRAEPLLATLDSLRHQTELPCEIVVIDDGLDDGSEPARIASADPRVRISRNERMLGVVASLARAIEDARAPLVTVLLPGDILLQGALRAVHDAIHASPDIGVAHSWWFPIGRDGRTSYSAMERHWKRTGWFVPAGLDYRRALVERGNIVQALPTFRRDLLQRSGALSGASLDEALFGAVLRVLNRARVQLVPRLLCGRPPYRGREWPLRGPRSYVRQLAQCYRAVRNGEAGYLRERRFGFAGPAGAGLLRSLLAAVLGSRGEQAYVTSGRLVHAARTWKSRAFRTPAAYGLLVALLQRWRMSSLQPSRRRPRPVNGARIAYVQWQDSTETFVRREIQALRDAGVHLEVFAVEPASPPRPPDPASPAGPVTYFGPMDRARARSFRRTLMRTRPWTLIRLRLWVIRHRYRSDKTWRRDASLFDLSTQLAAALAAREITHVHSPWADVTGVHCFIASGLLGITCSMQARASEVHRTSKAHAAVDRLRFADFVITNSRYNERYLGTVLTGPGAPPIHRIYNGLDLDRFPPREEGPRAAGPLRILSVGRMVEPKGFRYLLFALRILRDRGIDAVTEIIGGPQDPVDTFTWVELRRLHEELGLTSHVSFLGAQPLSEVLRAYRRADIFALPCVRGRDGSHDITPNAVIEAMAMGLPVVSTTSGAVPEIVRHESDGLLVPPNDEHALADALELLAGSPPLREALGNAARRTVEERFDGRRNVSARVELFRSSAPA